MAFPVRATMADIEAVCAYLLSKPTGATLTEARAVLDAGTLDIRKISALRFWGLIDEDAESGKMRLTERGRAVARDRGARKTRPLREALSSIAGYRTVVERAVHTGELTIAASEVAANWHQHYRDEASDSDEIINQQAICFFQLAEGADLGKLIVGRKGAPTRFEFHEGNARAFVEGSVEPDVGANTVQQKAPPIPARSPNRRVFISHTKNAKILDQIKRTVTSVGFEPVLFVDTDISGKAIAESFWEELKSCAAAVIHVGSEDKGKGERLNPNVLVELGAAMASCGNRTVLVVEDSVDLPTIVEGIPTTRYVGDSLDWDAGMKILEALRGFKGNS